MTIKGLPLVYLTRRETFSAAHRLWSDGLSEQQNRDLFGPCAYDHGHGHNYVLEVTLRGAVDPKTGILINLKEIRDVIHELVVDGIDHRHLNHDAPLTRGINPTAENLVVLFWGVLHQHYGKALHEVRLRETEKNWVTYTGKFLIELLARIRAWAAQMRQQLFTVYFAARDPRAPSRLRLLALAVAAYAISPIDLIPDVIPVAGWLDDLVIVPAGIAAILHWMPADVVTAARERAQQMHGRFAGYFAVLVVAVLWLIALRLLLSVALTHLN